MDATTNKVSLISSDTWTTTDQIENGVTDLNVTAQVEWYDQQEVFTGLKWSSML